MLDYLSYLPASDIELVRQAWRYADKAHTNQWRSSGDPYITHPIAVATHLRALEAGCPGADGRLAA